MPAIDCRCSTCGFEEPTRCYPTLSDPLVDEHHVCGSCGETGSMTYGGYVHLEYAPVGTTLVEHALVIMGGLSPAWCRIRNFHLQDDVGRTLPARELGKILTALTVDGLLEKRRHPANGLVQYRLTAEGLEAYRSILPDERPPNPSIA